jgi:uncharacterized repeat protein (TIGR03803 family)
MTKFPSHRRFFTVASVLSTSYGVRFIIIASAVLSVVAVQANAQTFTTLGTFKSSGLKGANPSGNLTLSGSTLYGTTNSGGTYGGGSIFSIPVAGGPLTSLASFNYTNGASPQGSLTLCGSTLYGMTSQGGASDKGTIFSIPAGGGPITTRATFDGTNGTYPSGDLTLVGSTLYGMTYGSGFDYGTIFSIPVGGGPLTTLATFDFFNGAKPYGSLTLSGSTLYGMTSEGGMGGGGTVFSIPVGGGPITTLATFNGANGARPLGDLTLVGSTLYGMTSDLYSTSASRGTIFSVPVGGGSVTTLATFDGANGSYPYGSLTLCGSNLYGMTSGLPHDGSTLGTIFSIPVGGGPLMTLVTFDGTNGACPLGDLTLSGSTLYGTTTGYFSNDFGTVFALTVPEPSALALLLTTIFGGLLWWRRKR